MKMELSPSAWIKMKIEKNKAVSIHYVLTNQNGDILDSTQGHPPFEYLHGADNILKKLEEELEGKGIKSRFQAHLSPAEGYGEYDEVLAQKVPLERFPNADQVKAGAQFQVDTSQGPKIATITHVDDETFTLDLNHPMAGQALHFDVEVMDIRDATPEEIEQGHIPMPGCGCGHDHSKDCGCDHSGGEKQGCDHGEKECGCGHSH